VLAPISLCKTVAKIVRQFGAYVAIGDGVGLGGNLLRWLAATENQGNSGCCWTSWPNTIGTAFSNQADHKFIRYKHPPSLRQRKRWYFFGF
jgi:hypothetical protein